MYRCVLGGLSCAALLALSLSLAGCDSGGVEQGVPKEIPKTSAAPIMEVDMAKDNPKFKAAAKKAATEGTTTTTPPAEKKD